MILKREKGITLISLVVTVIVLLILAGIVINAIVGNNGVIKKSVSSRDETRYGEVKEIVDKWKDEQESTARLNSDFPDNDDELNKLYRELIKQLKSEDLEDDDVIDGVDYNNIENENIADIKNKTITFKIADSEEDTRTVDYALTSRITIHGDEEGINSDINITYEWGMTWEEWLESDYNKENDNEKGYIKDAFTKSNTNVGVNSSYDWMVIYDKTDKDEEYAVTLDEKISPENYYEIDWEGEHSTNKTYTVMVYANFVNNFVSDLNLSYSPFKVTFEKGMTWSDWINSDYNTSDAYIEVVNGVEYVVVDVGEYSQTASCNGYYYYYYKIPVVELKDWNDSDPDKYNKTTYSKENCLSETVIDETAHYEMWFDCYYTYTYSYR